MTQKENTLAIIDESTRVGVTCATPGSVLLGEVSKLSPTHLDALRSDREGFAVIGDHAAIRYQGLSWYRLAEQSLFGPGVEATYFSSQGIPRESDLTKISAVGFPCVLTTKEEFIFASPAPINEQTRTNWDTSRGEHELARLALRKLMSQGFELDHMVTMILRTTLSGADDSLILEDGAHDTHHGKQNALSAIKRNFVGGTAKRSVGRLSSNTDWLLLPHQRGELVFPQVKNLSQDEAIRVLASGLAVASHALLKTVGANNPTLNTGRMGQILVDQILEIPNQTSQTAGEIANSLAQKIKTSRV